MINRGVFLRLFTWLITLQVLILCMGASISYSGITRLEPVIQHYPAKSRPDISGIMAVLEKKLSDHRLLEKAREKLLTLKDADIRLISMLCRQISPDSSVGSDIAFSLVSALIILS